MRDPGRPQTVPAGGAPSPTPTPHLMLAAKARRGNGNPPGPGWAGPGRAGWDLYCYTGRELAGRVDVLPPLRYRDRPGPRGRLPSFIGAIRQPNP